MAEAEALVETARKLEQEGQQLFGNDQYSVEEKRISYVKHAFVLSMYFLMRAQEKPIETIFDYVLAQCIKL